MSSREYYTERYKCPECGTEASIEWSEDDDPYAHMRSGFAKHGYNRSLESIEAPFRLISPAVDASNTKIECTKCDLLTKKI